MKERIAQIVNTKGLLIKVGSHYIIDKGFRKGGEIKLLVIYGKYFCRVKDLDTGTEWDTMCNRLSCLES